MQSGNILHIPPPLLHSFILNHSHPIKGGAGDFTCSCDWNIQPCKNKCKKKHHSPALEKYVDWKLVTWFVMRNNNNTYKGYYDHFLCYFQRINTGTEYFI